MGRRLQAALAAGLCVAALVAVARAQESPARRAANIVGVAVEEYSKGVDDRGQVVAAEEYQEATDFLEEARRSIDQLPGARPADARAVLDSIVAAVAAKRPPGVIRELAGRFGGALGGEAALELPKGAIDLAEGRRIYAQGCASCHGASGRGDGPAAAALSPRPPAIGSAELARGVSPATMYRIVSVGISGTPMAGFARTLTPDQRWNVVSYVTSLRATPAQVSDGKKLYAHRSLPPEVGSFAWQVERSDDQLAAVVRGNVGATRTSGSAELTDAQVRSLVAYLRTLPLENSVPATARTVLTILDQALDEVRAGRADEAGEKAFDAYVAFEPLETLARARDPGAVASLEKQFADFKAAVRANDVPAAERVRDAIKAAMPHIVELASPTASRWEAFLQSFLIILREGFEAILVIGAIVAFLVKTGHRHRLRSIWTGVALGLAASVVTAVAIRTLLSAVPASREVIEGVTMLVAVVVLFSVSYWLISRVEAAKWQRFIREKLSGALKESRGAALAFVAFLAVYREGAETALFYQALLGSDTPVALPIGIGMVAGFAALTVLFTLFYQFGVRIPLRLFFGVTSVLLYYMAFVFMGRGVRELQEGNVVPIAPIAGFPHVEALGIYPTWQTVAAQLLLLALVVLGVARTFWPKRSAAAQVGL